MVSQGEIIWLDFDPQTGHEQKGRRPALVVSNETFNHFSNLAVVCPVTNTNKKHPFHVPLDDRTKTTGLILCDQARTLDIKARHYTPIETVPDDILFEAVDNGLVQEPGWFLHSPCSFSPLVILWITGLRNMRFLAEVV